LSHSLSCRYPEPKSFTDKDVSDNVESDDVKRGSETDSNMNMATYFHKIGDPQSKDTLIFSDPTNPKWMFRTSVSTDGEYIIIKVSNSTAPVNHVYVAKASDVVAHIAANPGGPVAVQKIVENFDAGYNYVTNVGDTFYFKTNKEAPKYKVGACTFHTHTHTNIYLSISSIYPFYPSLLPIPSSNIIGGMQTDTHTQTHANAHTHTRARAHTHTGFEISAMERHEGCCVTLPTIPHPR
jgi:hypothetical protein